MPPRCWDEPPLPAWLLAAGPSARGGLDVSTPLWAVGLVALLLLSAWHDSLPLPLPLLTALFLPGLVAVCVEGGLMS